MKTFSKFTALIIAAIMVLGVCAAGFTAFADGLDGYTVGTGVNPDNATNKPNLVVSSTVLSLAEAEANPVVTVTVSVSGANQSYCNTGLHIEYDSRLTLVERNGQPAEKGPAIEYHDAICFTDGSHGLYLRTEGSGNTGQDGVLWSFDLRLPDSVKSGDEFPVNIVYKSSQDYPDRFASTTPNSATSRNMEAYAFTKGITHGGIKVSAQSVQKKTPDLSVDISGTYCNGIVTCDLTTNVTGYYYIFLDDEFYTYQIGGSTTSLNLNLLPSVPMAAGSHSVTVIIPENDEYKSAEITKEFTIPNHTPGVVDWNWDDVDHPVYTQKCTECGATTATGTVDSTKGITAEATVDADGYTCYSASVKLESRVFGQEIRIIDEGSMLAKRKEVFEEYKSDMSDYTGTLVQEGDSAACIQLIMSAQESIAVLEYDEELSLETNKDRVDNIVTEVENALAERRRQYTATFVNEDGDTVGKAYFTMDTLMLDASDVPAVPVIDGYTGKWEEYELGTKDITIHPVYTAIEYTATFVNEAGETVKTETFTVKSESIAEPAVPEKAGYEGKWSEYTIAAADIEIRPVYTVIEYTATFVDENGAKIAEVPFTVESESIEEPAVPEKGGYEAAWEEYEIGAGDLTIKPVYTPTDICPLDDEYHGTSFWGKLTKFLHTVIWKAFNLIGLNVYFRIS